MLIYKIVYNNGRMGIINTYTFLILIKFNKNQGMYNYIKLLRFADCDFLSLQKKKLSCIKNATFISLPASNQN